MRTHPATNIRGARHFLPCRNAPTSRRSCLIGSGPIIIGQACEFDYSGTQACKALREEGYTVVLVNSNPATIMTDPEMADRTYIEPITWQVVAKIIEKERPDALLAHARRADRPQHRDGLCTGTACWRNSASR